MFLLRKIKETFYSSFLLKALLFIATWSYQPNIFSLDGDLNTQEMAELEEELERIKNLPPEEQEQIYQDMYQEVMSSLTPEERAEVEAATEKLMSAIEAAGGEEVLNQLSPEELEKFFTEVLDEDKPKPEAAPTPTIKKEEPKEVVKKVSSKQEQALVLIDSVIEQIQSLIRKTKSIPEISEQIDKWTKDKKIVQWDPSLKWEQIKTNLEVFVQKLEKIKDKDPKTKVLKYLDDFIENKTLHQNLRDLEKDLKKQESSIDVESFGLKKVGETSKVALQKTINSLNKAIVEKKAPEEIDKIIEKYEPKAKQLREKEEAAQKKAEAEAKKPSPRGPAIAAGRPEQPSMGYDQRSGYRQPGTYQAPYQPTVSPGVSPDRQKTTASQKPAKKEAAKDSKGKSPEKKEVKNKEDEKNAKLIEEIKNDISKAESLVVRNNTMVNIRTHITNTAQPVDQNLNLRIIIRKIDNPRGGIIQSIESLKKKVANASPEKKQEYKKQLRDAYNKNADTLDDVAQQIQGIKKDWSKIRASVSNEKKEAYLDATPYGLYDLQTAVDRLNTAIDKFTPSKR